MAEEAIARTPAARYTSPVFPCARVGEHEERQSRRCNRGLRLTDSERHRLAIVE